MHEPTQHLTAGPSEVPVVFLVTSASSAWFRHPHPLPRPPGACRTGFFLMTSASSVIAHHVSATLAAGGAAASGQKTPFQNLSANVSSELTNRLYEGIAM